MRNLNKSTFLTVAALATDKIEIVTYPNGDWFANADFELKNKWYYVDTEMYNGKTSRDKFERQAVNNGLAVNHETVTFE